VLFDRIKIVKKIILKFKKECCLFPGYFFVQNYPGMQILSIPKFGDFKSGLTEAKWKDKSRDVFLPS